MNYPNRMVALMFRYLIDLLTRHFLCFIQQFERLRTKLRRNAGGRANPRLRRPQDESYSRVVELPILARGSRKNTYRHGGGAQHRFGESRLKLEDLWMVGISHLHPDHVSDLPAFLWLSHEVRKEPLKIFGPTGNDAAP